MLTSACTYTTLIYLFISFISVAELTFQLRHVLMVSLIRNLAVIAINAIVDKHRDVTPDLVAAH